MIIIEIILLVYFIYVVGYAAFFAIAANLHKSKEPPQLTDPSLRFAVLIPSYKEDAVILDSAEKALNQTYPKSLYDVVVIADNLKPSTIVKLREMPIRVVEVSFKNSTKVKSLNKALATLPDDQYDYLTILDADNLMAPDYLERMSGWFSTGKYRVVQGQRKPKNDQTTLAFLDGVSESINNAIYRQGTAAAGLSSSISGSGFAGEFVLLKQRLSNMSSIGGFDRELEVILLGEGIHTYYDKHTVVYDEKVSKSKNFQNQRKRWISSQYVYLAKYFKRGMKALFKGNFAYFNSSVLRNIQLPRLLNIGLLFFVTVLFYLIKPVLALDYAIWPVLFVTFAVVTFMAIPREFFGARLFRSILELPMLFIRMFTALLGLKGANKKFIHTPHES